MTRFFTSIMIFTIITAAFAGRIDFEISHSPDDFEIVRGDFVKVYIDGGVVAGKPGFPQSIAENRTILLPPNSRATSIRIESAVWLPLTAGTPFPAQPPAILSAPSPGISPPDNDIYLRSEWFPADPMIGFSSGNMAGYSVVGIAFAPIRWNPSAGICEYLESATIHAEYTYRSSISPSKRTAAGDLFWKSAISGLVANPEDINGYLFDIDPDAYDWAAFVPTSLLGHMQPLLKLRRSWGLRDTVLSMEYATSSYPGIDDAERLRAAIADLYEDFGITFALIVGDTGLAPMRTVYAMDSEAGFYDDENLIRADLYFGDLDGDWNFDGDTIWGEIEDSVDMFADVLVGRFSLSTVSHLDGLIEKLERYESIPPGGFAEHGLMLGQVMWDDPWTDGGEFKDDLIETVFPDYFDFGRVYSTAGGDAPTALDSLDSGPNLINHAGHANSAVICLAHGSCIFLTEMDFLTNATRPSIFFSIGCWPAAFDKNCIAEHYMNNPNGGGAAFIGNSRYGWGSPGNAGWGYSEVLDRVFWNEIFSGNYALGAALEISKARFVPFAQWENIWRWVIYQVNILGDPATGAITEDSPITIDYEIEGGDIGITVEGTSEPACGATVAAFDDYGLIDRSTTDSHGFAHLSISSGTAPIYIAARNGSDGFAAETLSVGATSGFFRYDYSSGYGYSDGLSEPGDTVEIELSLGGFDYDITGLDWSPSANFGAPLWIDDPPPTIDAGDSAVFGAAYYIPEGVPIDTSLIVDPGIAHSGGTLGYKFSLPINTASMRIVGNLLGDSDSSLDPGETSELWIIWMNAGSGRSSEGSVFVTSPGGELDITGSPMTASSVMPGDTIFIGPFDIAWSSGATPSPIVEIEVEYSPYPPETLYLATSPLGFETDVESSEAPFSTSGGTQWHRTTRRSHSGVYSWWCGVDGFGTYTIGMDDDLHTEGFAVGDDSELRFWAYAEFPNYGSDGLHVEILGASDTVELDYIGSGGALLNFIIGWSEYRYPLGELPFEPGDSIEVHFRFTSDMEDVAEGIFLDDISLSCPRSGFTTGIEDGRKLPDIATLRVYPNPFNASLSIEFSGEIPTGSSIGIFDITGRMVNSILARSKTIWDGTSSNGDKCASGVYFVRLISPSRTITTKAVLLE